MRNIEEYAKEYMNDYDFEQYQVKYRRRKILEVLNEYKPESLLEIGCGLTPIGEFYKGLKAYTIVEPSVEFCEKARSCLGDGTEIINDFFSAALCGYRSYDMIICSSLLHEVEDPKLLLREIFKASSENTILHVNVPNAYSLHRLLAIKSGLIEDVKTFSDRNKILQQHMIFDMDELVSLMSEMGFVVLEKGQYFMKPFSHNQMQKIMEHGIIDERVLDGLYEFGKENFGSEIYVNAKIA